MYSRKVQQSILYTTPNLKAVGLEKQIHSTRNYFFRYSFLMRQITLEEACSTLKNKLRAFNKEKLIDVLKAGLTAVPRSLKEHSSSALKVWARQCECVVAQRLRRGQQMFCLYTKLWEEHALREFLRKMRQHMMKRGKEFMLGAVGITSYNWEKNRIPDAEIRGHMDEISFLYFLKDKTFFCDECKRKKPDPQKPNITQCMCNKSHRGSYDSWEIFIEREDLIVWRRPLNGYYEYKVYGSYDDVTAIDFLDTQIDTEYRKKWDNTAVILEIVEKDKGSNSDIIYWEMLWPRLFANRDYVFNRRYVIDKQKNVIVFKNVGTKHPAYPAKSDKYRIEDYYSYMVIKPYTDLDKPGIEFGLTYYDNPGISIPDAITAWVAMKAMPEFLKRLRGAAKEYKKFMEEFGQFRTSCKSNPEDRLPEDDSVLETSLQRNNIPVLRPRREDRKIGTETVLEKRDVGIGSMEALISPTVAATQAVESEGSSYWKYLRPTYYFG